MLRRFFPRRFFYALCLLLCLLPPADAAAPRRIVSLAPGVTEMLFALGLGRSVVGDTVYCDFPPAARAVAKIGDVNTNYERVLALHPDLIVADAVANGRAIARLRQLRQTVLVVSPTSLAAVEDSLRTIAAQTGRAARASVVVAGMEGKARQAAALAAGDRRPRPRVLLVIQVAPLWTAGGGTFLDDLVVRAGGVNVGAAIKGYGPLSRERVLSRPPDVVVGDVLTVRAVRADSLLGRLAAVRAGRLYALSGDLTQRPGPRLADGLLLLARALHGR